MTGFGTRRGPALDMQIRTLPYSLAPFFVASLAHAQAPGDAVAPSAAPPVVTEAGPPAPCADCREPVMANRWSIGVSVGSLGVAPNGSPQNRSDFAVGEVELRFRATPHLELEVASASGQDPNDEHPSYLRLNAVTLAARYRFMPEATWNWFVMGGVGAAAIAVHDATDQERRDATQALGMVGIGVERRFDHLALQAELRGISLGRRTSTTAADMSGTTTSAMSTTTTEPARTGSSLTIGLSYYF
jgi:opacity protein-like surface antigen